MAYTKEMYEKKLKKIKINLSAPPDDLPEEVKMLVNPIVKLVVAQIHELNGISEPGEEADPLALRKHLEEFSAKLTNTEDKKMFGEYAAMVDSLINEGVKDAPNPQ